MKTITENLLERMKLQADEADLLGLNKIAGALTDQIQKASIRKDSDKYCYASEDLKKDVESALWDAVVRVADFYNKSFDAKETQDTVEAIASALISELAVKMGSKGVGAYEPTVPGEERKQVMLEIEE